MADAEAAILLPGRAGEATTPQPPAAARRAPTAALGSLYLAVFVDFAGGLMVMPLLPFLGLEMGASAFWISFMAAFFSLAQVFGTMLMGMLSDRVGRQKVVLLGLGATAASLFALALAAEAGSFAALLLLRGVNGFFSGTVGVAQAYIADLVDPGERTSAMGKVGALTGLGMILGPGLGGALSRGGFVLVSLVAAGLTLLNFSLALASLPLDRGVEQRLRKPEEPALGGRSALAEAMRGTPGLACLYACQLQQMTAFGLFTGVLAIFLHDTYGTTPAQMGNIYVVSGVTMAFVQGLALEPLASALGPKRCLLLGNVTRLLSYWILTVGGMQATCLSYASPMMVVVGGGLINPCLASLAASRAPHQLRGAVLGGLQAVGSLGQFAGPLAAGALFDIDERLPFYAAAALSGVGCVATLAVREPGPDGRGAGCGGPHPAAAAAAPAPTRGWLPCLLRGPAHFWPPKQLEPLLPGRGGA